MVNVAHEDPSPPQTSQTSFSDGESEQLSSHPNDCPLGQFPDRGGLVLELLFDPHPVINKNIPICRIFIFIIYFINIIFCLMIELELCNITKYIPDE